MTSEAQSAMNEFVGGSVNYVQLKINASGEVIDHVTSKSLEAGDISALTPLDEPRYHFFKYHHSFEDNTIDSIGTAARV